MFAKVHPPEDVQSGNTASCHDLVRYLQKESGNDLSFFSHTEQDVSPEKVIGDIDANRSKLSANDAKFYMLSLNPSRSEQIHLIGREVGSLEELTPEERQAVFRKLERFTRSAMDEYAANFQRDSVRSGGDLLYYAKIETQRTYSPTDEEVKKGMAKIGEVKPGLNLHVHVLVSRKSLDGKVKLSPAASLPVTPGNWREGARLDGGSHTRTGKSGYRSVLMRISNIRRQRRTVMSPLLFLTPCAILI